jgi:Tol biopolymer transport system component
MKTGRTRIASIKQDGTAAGGGANSPAISSNGRYVAWSSFATDIVSGDTNGNFDVFLTDRATGVVTRVSVDSAGTEALDGASFEPTLSDDGMVVAFASEATNLVAGDTNQVRDVFVHYMATGQTVRASVATDGTQADGQSDGPGIRGGTTFGPQLSADGTRVVFDSIATNLVPGDTNTCTYSPGGQSFPLPGQCPDVFVRDLQAGTTSRVSVNTSGGQADDASTDPAISGDGTDVAFFTTAAFASDDTNTCPPFFFGHSGECPDIYLHVG